MELKLRLDYICVDKPVRTEPYLSEDAFNLSWRMHPLKNMEILYADYELNDSDILSFKITRGPADSWKISRNDKLIDRFTCSEEDLFLSTLKGTLLKDADKLTGHN